MLLALIVPTPMKPTKLPEFQCNGHLFYYRVNAENYRQILLDRHGIDKPIKVLK
jgi:hypothetical protein